MVSHFFPGLTASLKALPDRRDPDLTGYSAATLCWTLILMYATRLGSRRQIGRHLNEPEVWGRLSLLAGEAVTSTPHGDTAAGYLDTVPVERTQEVPVELVRTLLEGRCLESFRLLDTYYMFAFDLSGQLVLGDTPSAFTTGCLTQQMKDGRTIYYRPVEEAKLVTPTGLALSVGSEFVENPLDRPDSDPQDSELPAAARLFPKVKKSFPRLPVCALLDSRYANDTGFALCEANDWRYIMTLKEGSLPSVYHEFDALLAQTPENRLTVIDKKRHERRDYAWASGIAYGGRTLNALECIVTPLATGKKTRRRPGQADAAPTSPKKPTRFRWVTDLPVGRALCESLGHKGGRQRWKIENEGFRTQKHAGFAMEHAYVKRPQAAKNFYLLLQIAHLLCQIYECYWQGKRTVKRVFGSLINLARNLLEAFRRDRPLAPEAAAAFFTEKIRVSLDTS